MEYIKIDKIIVKENIRKDYGNLTELTESIKKHGIMKPLELTKGNELVDGFRRLKAAIANKYTEVPYFYGNSKVDKITEQLLSGIFSKNLNPVEEGKAFRKYMDQEKIKVEDMAKKISKPVIYVEKRLLIANLPKEAQDALIENKILIGHAVILSKFTKDDSVKLLKEIIKQNMGVETTRNHIQYRFSTQISTALFDKKDCKNCKYNGSCQSELFETGKVLNGNCMNLGCFMKKKADRVKQRKEEYKDVLFKSKDDYETPKGFTSVPDSRLTRAYVLKCKEDRENYLVRINEHGEVGEYFRIPPRKAEKETESGKEKSEKQEPRNQNSLQEFKTKFLIDKSIEFMKPGSKEAKVLTLIQLISKSNWNEMEFAYKKFLGIKVISNDGIINVKEIFELKEPEIDKAISVLSETAFRRLDMKGLIEISENFGVDMKKHFEITEEFLKLHTKAQLLQMIKELGIKTDQGDDAKKDDLMSCILDHDTKGKVPKTL